MMRIVKSGLLIFLLFLLAACTSLPRPNNVENIGCIFNQYPEWYADARKSEDKWGISVSTQMAIIYQESSFTARARPPRKKILCVIPWKRPSSAYGYSQALKGTWKDYQNNISQNAKRHEFSAATDFIGWYSHQVCEKLDIESNNAYALYLAYHEGMTGYQHRNYWRKPWLIRVAHKVADRANVYQQQLTAWEEYYLSKQ